LAGWVAWSPACNCDGRERLGRFERNLVADPVALDFGTVPVGSKATRTLTLTERGEATVTISHIEIRDSGGVFSIDQAPAVPITLGPKASARLSVSFTPPQQGEFEGRITFTSSDPSDAPTVVPLSGIGSIPGLMVDVSGAHCGGDPNSVDFGFAPVGTSVDRPITLRSATTGTLTITSLALEVPHSQFELIGAPGPGTTIQPGGSIDFVGRFTPAHEGADSNTILLATNAVVAPNRSIPLCGVGGTPSLCARPVPLDFGAVPLMRTSTATLQLSNCGTQPLSINAVTLSQDAAHPTDPRFVIRSSYSATLMPGDLLDVPVSFTASSIGAATGFMRVDSDADGMPVSYFPVVARAVEDCELTVEPLSLSYGSVNPPGVDKRVLVMNTGPTRCTWERAEITMGGAAFSLPSPPALPAVLQPGDSSILAVHYAGGASVEGVLEIEAGRSIRHVQLYGGLGQQAGCHIDLDPTVVNFGVVAPGTTQMRSLTVTNVSASSACNIQSILLDALSDPGFVAPTQDALGSQPPGAIAHVGLGFVPAHSGSAIGTLHISTDDVVTPMLDVPLIAAGTEVAICVEPRLLQFQNVSGFSDQSFTISACGSHSVSVTSLGFSRADSQYALPGSPTVPFTLAAGSQQVVSVRYTPASASPSSAVITVGSSDPVTPSIDVDAIAGAIIVPPSAGRILYFWRAQMGQNTGDVMRLALQGQPTLTSFRGSMHGDTCVGCHTPSPDGRYVAVVQAGPFSLQVIDTRNGTVVPGFSSFNTLGVSWRPDVNSSPPYQFACDDSGVIKIASPSTGLIGSLRGADSLPPEGQNGPSQMMPSWGPNGKIAFARGQVAGLGFSDRSDIMLVDETGGVAEPLRGASGTGDLNYYPAFSPNGRWIAFTNASGPAGTLSRANPTARIRIVSANQSGVVLPLSNANGSGASSFPTWSNDGTLLSFSSNRPGGMGGWDIWYAPIDPVTGADGAAVNFAQVNTPEFEHIARWSR
jgi:hypothetical protein